MKSFPIRFESFVVVGEKLYFVDYYFNMVGEYDLLKKCINVIAFIDAEPRNKERLFGEILYSNGYLYLIPFSAKKVYVVEVCKGVLSSIELPDISSDYKKYDINAKFLSAHIVGDRIIMFPATFPAIAAINIQEKSISFIIERLDLLINCYDTFEDSFFRKTVYMGDSIYAPLCMKDAILKLNIIDDSFIIIDLKETGSGFSSMCYDGKYYWLLQRRGNKVIRWNENGNETLECAWDEKVRPGDIAFFRDRVLLFPASFGHVISIKDMKLESYIEKIGRYAKYKCEKDLYISDYYNGKLFHVDVNENVEEIALMANSDMISYYHLYFTDIYKQYLQGVDIVCNEDSENTLSDYINLINQ